MNKSNIQIDLDEKIIEFICNETNDENEKIRTYITDIVSYVCKEKGIDCDKISISIYAVSKEEIKNINNEYRNIDKVTDVLSFPIFTREEVENFKLDTGDKKLKEIELGDIILCLDVVKNQSIEYNTGVLRETLYMITHGVCHLVGYDHIEDEEKVEMRAMEEKVLGNIGVQ